MNTKRETLTISWTLILVFVVFVAATLVGGLFYYRFQSRSIVEDKQVELLAIADLKIRQIVSWRSERELDALLIRANSALARQIHDYFHQGTERKQLLVYLASLCRYGGYSSATLVDENGMIRLSFGSHGDSIGTTGRELSRRTFGDRTIIMSDLFVSEITHLSVLDLCVPIELDASAPTPAIGVLILRIDPSFVLYPLVQSWPTPSKSSETLLIRREGDQVVYLNELRHQQNTALNFRVPIGDPNLPAAKAARGFEGIVEGSDYRRIPVLAAIRAVPQSTWKMVSKVDQEEVYAPLRQQAWLVALVIFMLIFGASSAIGLWWRHQRAVFYRTLYEAEAMRKEGEQRYHSLFEHMLEGFAYCRMLYENGSPSDFIYLEVNRAFESLTSLKDVKGKRVTEVIPGIRDSNPELIETYGRVARSGVPERLETFVPGLGIWFSIAVYSPEAGFFVAVFDNITDRKRAEEALRESEERLRMSQQAAHVGSFEWNMITGVNIWTPELEAMYGLLPGSFARTQPAWESLIHPDDRSAALASVQKAFDTNHPCEGEWRVVWADKSIHWLFGRFQVIRDSSGKPVRLIGVNIDITERMQAEAKLRQSEERYHTLFETMIEGFCTIEMIYDDDGRPVDYRFLEINPAFESQSGLQNVQGRLISELAPDNEAHWFEIYGRVALTGESARFENEARALGRHFSVCAWRLGGEGSHKVAILFTDITERYRAQEKLRASEQLYRGIGESIDYGVWVCDPEGRNTYASPSFLKMVGITQEQCSEFGWGDVLHPDDAERTIAAWKECVRTEGNWDIQHRFRGVDGEWHHVLARGVPVRDEQGRVSCWAGINLDITDRKRMEEALYKSNAILQAVNEGTANLICVKDRQGKIVLANPAMTRFIGKPESEIIGKSDLGYVADVVQAAKIMEDDRKIMESGQSETVEEVGDSPGGRWTMLFTKSPYRDAKGEVVGVIGVGTDVTERKRAELEFQKLSLRNSAILSSVPDIIMEVDNNKVYTWANSAGVEFFGDDVIGKAAHYFFESEQDTYRNVTPLFDGQEDVIYLESWQRRRDGEKRLLAWWCRVLKDESGNVTGALSTARDITELKRAGEAIRASEEKFRNLFEHSPLGKSMTGLDGSLHVNKAFCDLLGYSEEELRSKTWKEISHPEDIKETENVIQSLLSGESFDARLQKRYVHKNGSIIWTDVSTALFRDFAGKPEFFITTVLDITHRKKMEESLQMTLADLKRSNEELEQFAYVASHDLQEPLRMVASYTQLLERRYKDKLDVEAHEFIKYAVDGARRMQVLINDLLQYSRIETRGKPFVKIDCNSVLGRVRANLTGIIEDAQALLTHDDLPTITCDEQQLERLFQNLVDNGIKFHGETTPIVHVSAKAEKGFWIFSIRDNGIGISHEYHDRIFQIFQRLHEREKYDGTGIGLAIAKRVVERHGGTIWFESEPGHGTTFYFTLPRNLNEDVLLPQSPASVPLLRIPHPGGIQEREIPPGGGIPRAEH